MWINSQAGGKGYFYSLDMLFLIQNFYAVSFHSAFPVELKIMSLNPQGRHTSTDFIKVVVNEGLAWILASKTWWSTFRVNEQVILDRVKGFRSLAVPSDWTLVSYCKTFVRTYTLKRTRLKTSYQLMWKLYLSVPRFIGTAEKFPSKPEFYLVRVWVTIEIVFRGIKLPSSPRRS